ncbi:MAG: Maf family protein [Clostridiales bacterium]|nr:Maf family protein [Clostridiales bacterium]
MLVLASESPRRRELLRLIANDFEVKSSKQDESLPAGISPCNAVIYLSKIKAEPFKSSNDIVIGADTVVAVENKILGKPKDEKDAFEMLSLLSGRQHSVFTGVTIIKGSVVKSFYCRTMVKFYNLSEKEIKSYISCGECLDKAGAYGIQGKGSLLVEKIDGDYFNVVGLPVAKLYRELKALL